MITRTGRLAPITLALAAVTLAAAPAAAAAAGRRLASLEVGFESFRERYTVADDDTLSSLSEAYSRLRLGYALGALGRDYALLEARGMLGESSYEAGAHALAARRFGAGGRHAFNLEADVGRRGYRAGSQYEFPNGYTRALARGTLRWRAGGPVFLRLDDRIEQVDYDERTEFDNDFTRNAATASVDWAGLTHACTAGLRFTTMNVPDSSEIDYHSLTPLVEYRAYVDPHRRVLVTTGAERRIYDGVARSSFWALLGSGSFEWLFHPRWSFELDDELEYYRYDLETAAYPSYVRNTVEALVNFNRAEFQVGAGPAFGWLESGDSPLDEYRELGVKVALEWVHPTGALVSAGYQPGWRDYTAYDGSPGPGEVPDPEAIFSDYSYHRFDLFANLRVYHSLWLNAYADYQPEDHDRAGDDATATVASIAVTYSF